MAFPPDSQVQQDAETLNCMVRSMILENAAGPCERALPTLPGMGLAPRKRNEATHFGWRDREDAVHLENSSISPATLRATTARRRPFRLATASRGNTRSVRVERRVRHD